MGAETGTRGADGTEGGDPTRRPRPDARGPEAGSRDPEAALPGAGILPRRPYVHAIAARRALAGLLAVAGHRPEAGGDGSGPPPPPGEASERAPAAPVRPGTRILRILTVAVWIALAVALVGMLGCGAPASEEPDGAGWTAPLPLPPATTTVADTLRAGETLAGLLHDHDIGPTEVAFMADLLRSFTDPRALRPGTEVRFIARETAVPHRIELALDADRTVRMFTVGARWTAALDSVPVTRDTVLVGGLVRSNLYAAELFGDADALVPREHGELVHRLSRIFGWEIDFWRDVRAGDVYGAALERTLRPDGSLRSFRVLAAEYRGRRGVHTAIRFGAEGRRAAFFDPEGRSLRGAFLQAPLDFVRVTSRFGRRRYHPILRRARAHLGVDYGAPAGTPVRATGEGVVTRAGWWGGYGRIVELRHGAGFRTRYAHLSSIGRGIRPGVRVEGGQVIGRVGSTGLSTAPHLHYEFLANGRHVDPRRAPVPRAEPVSAEERPRFEETRAGALRLLEELRPPGLAVVAASDARPEAATGLDD